MAKPKQLRDERISTFGKLLEVNARLQRILGNRLEEDLKLPLSWFEVLLRVSRSEGEHLSMTALADQVVLTPGGVTRLIDRIEEAGFVARVPCPTDRRVNWIELTPSGWAILNKAVAAHLQHLESEFVDRLAPSDMKGLVNALDTLHDSLHPAGD